MPPTSNMRKSTANSTTAGDATASSVVARNGVQPRRTARANTTRPANYYARPFGSFSNGVDNDNDPADSGNPQQPGFFPALQYFTDAITALPKEVQKQITLVKEVEAKVHGPNENMGEILDALLELPVPSRKVTNGAGGNSTAGGLLSLTANNSTSGSANVSLVNGMAGRYSVQPSIVGSVNGDEPIDLESERARRQLYHNLRMVTAGLLPNLDEKNVVLSEATRVLGLQQTRLDSVWPHVESELNEEAMLGSMTHWAYSDNRQKTKSGAPGAQNRRDVAATNSLAAAANMLHETEIAQARRDAGREAIREKTKGKRTEQPGDSDFDDKPRKAAKVSKKAAANGATAAGLGISTNGEPATKRKKAVEKALGGSGMERTVSATGKAAKANKETPRSTPNAEPTVKKTKGKPGPLPKKKMTASAQNSPLLVSSPLVASSNPLLEPPNGRPQSARARQSSAATNLRHEKVQDEEAVTSRPTSAAGKSNANGNGEKTNGRRRIHETTEEHDEISNTRDERAEPQFKDAAEKLKREDIEMPDAGPERTAGSNSGSNSNKGSGRNSKTGTPKTDSLPGDAPSMSRTRSTRSKPNARGEGDDSDSVEPSLAGSGAGKHRRHASNSHLVKQLAPFNRSPDLDRHRDKDDMDEDLDSLEDKNLGDEEVVHEEEPPLLDHETRRSSTRRPVSRRNTLNNLRSSPMPMSRESSPPVSPPPTNVRSTGRSNSRREFEAEPVRDEVEEPEPVAPPEPEDEDDESEHDPDDPDEPKYCYCDRGSYGEMIACDNDACPREWFHLGCTELREAPSEEEKWYCRECRPLFGQKVGRKKSGRGRGG